MAVKTHLSELISQALLDLQRLEKLAVPSDLQIQIDRTRQAEHGDFACNVALVLGKRLGINPRELAEKLKSHLLASRHVEKVEVAGPGFLNFFQTRSSLQSLVRRVLAQGHEYGREPADSRSSVTVEFVSANPTGPLHVGHGRGAAYGASLSSLLEARGYRVQREYYVNDNGRQMDILAASVWLRYLELCGERLRFPDNGYRGEYVYDIARELRRRQGDALRHSVFDVEADLPADESQGGDKELYIDAVVNRCKSLLGEKLYRIAFDAGLDAILGDIRDDLNGFNVHFERWYSERSLATSGAIDRALARLQANGLLEIRDGATWFKAQSLGDEKDRVVVRENGQTTYFASDIAYLHDKLERGFERLIYVFGADHHGYIARLKAAAKGLGEDPARLEIKLIQFAVLFRAGQKVQMSTRSGQFVTLRELREDVGSDACRFFYVMRSQDQHLDFDLDLAKSQSNDNPVFYVQYAHARICSVLRQLDEQMRVHNKAVGDAALDRLVAKEELDLLRCLSRYIEVLDTAAEQRSPHLVANYLREVAGDFHAWYNANQFLVEGEDLRNARLNLALATRQILRNGLQLLGVSAPEKM